MDLLKENLCECPWGTYQVLHKKNGHQVKHITVNPKQRLSLQLHHQRDEHWVIVKGTGEVTLNDKIIHVKKNDKIFIHKHMRHRVLCTSDIPLEFIEVQLGPYLEEDDIVRFDDDYGRA